MKIDVSGGYGIYRGQRPGETAKFKEAPAEGAKKSTDVAEFSRGNTSISDKSLVSLKSAIQRDINAQAAPERIELLRADIKNGTYHVPTEALVDSILGE